MAGASAREADAAARQELAGRLREAAGSDSVLLVTCHRVELYSTSEPHEPRFSGIEAFRHLARVAAGLESAVPGEGEVLHQVRAAFAAARHGGRLDPELTRAFELAMAAGRRARAGLGRTPAGLADAAVAWLLWKAPALSEGATVVVAGRGPVGRRMATLLAGAGAQVVVSTRTPGRGEVSLAEGAATAARAAAIAVALAGPWSELSAVPDVPLADLSWPRAVKRGDRSLDLDSITPQAAAPEWVVGAEAAVAEAVAEYTAWLASRRTAEVISALVERAERRRSERVRRVMRRLGALDERQSALVEQLSRQLVADLLHEPLSALRAGAGEEAVRESFRL